MRIEDVENNKIILFFLPFFLFDFLYFIEIEYIYASFDMSYYYASGANVLFYLFSETQKQVHTLSNTHPCKSKSKGQHLLIIPTVRYNEAISSCGRLCSCGDSRTSD